jgi:hypothetical protein
MEDVITQELNVIPPHKVTKSMQPLPIRWEVIPITALLNDNPGRIMAKLIISIK